MPSEAPTTRTRTPTRVRHAAEVTTRTPTRVRHTAEVSPTPSARVRHTAEVFPTPSAMVRHTAEVFPTPSARVRHAAERKMNYKPNKTINIMETVIKLTEINKIYRTDEVETQALENVNIEVKRGEFLSIMGPSGCGKSTLLNIMGLLDEPTSGTIELCGTKIDPKLSDNQMAELRNKTLGFVFQSFHLISTLNVLDNVQIPLIYRGVRSGERLRLAKEVIERVGLSHRMKHRPSQLSGGQCQRVAIARAIIGNPEILLADEPTGNLDSKMGAEIMELLHRLNREDGRTIVMVTHNEQQAKQTDRIIKFLDGRQIQ